MFSILIIDDEKPAREELKYLLKQILQASKIFEASCGEQALQIIKNESIDIAFVDINMQGMDGISLSKEIYKLQSEIKIIFATAYDAYAVKAFELNAADYILKPFEEERIRLTVDRLIKSKEAEKKNQSNSAQNLVTGSGNNLKKLSLWKNDRVIPVDIKDIVYIVVDDKNLLIKSIKGEFSTKECLLTYEKKLESEHFLRVHRSYIINLEHVKEILPWFNNTFIVKMVGFENDEIPVSRNYIKQFKDAFGL